MKDETLLNKKNDALSGNLPVHGDAVELAGLHLVDDREVLRTLNRPFTLFREYGYR